MIVFNITNTDRSNKNGTHWSFVDLHSKKIFYWVVSILKVLKSLFFRMIKKYATKLPYGIEKFNEKVNKITSITPKFPMRDYEKIKNKNRLSETAIDLLHRRKKYRKNMI